LKRDSFRFAFPSTLSANAALVGFRLATNAVANKKRRRVRKLSGVFLLFDVSSAQNFKRLAFSAFGGPNVRRVGKRSRDAVSSADVLPR
jgi:hypothetical protein